MEELIKENFVDVIKYHFPARPIDLSLGFKQAYVKTSVEAKLSPQLWRFLNSVGWGYDEMWRDSVDYVNFIVVNGVLNFEIYHKASESTGWKFPTIEERKEKINKFLLYLISYFNSKSFLNKWQG